MATNNISTENKLKDFLDSNQYNRRNILKYERIFGKTFVSTGGEKTTTVLFKELQLKPGDKVLDVGCGIGGAAFYLARCYQARVVGLDLSTNMMDMALSYLTEQEEDVRQRVEFELNDITKKQYEPSSFDAIYSRDCILHISDKEGLFKKFLTWLKPGGRLLITDYCRGKGDQSKESDEFKTYVQNRGYHLLTVSQYGDLLRKVGFKEVKDVNMTSEFIDILRQELQHLQSIRETFIQEFSEDDYGAMKESWTSKIHRCNQGDHAWGLFVAIK